MTKMGSEAVEIGVDVGAGVGAVAANVIVYVEQPQTQQKKRKKKTVELELERERERERELEQEKEKVMKATQRFAPRVPVYAQSFPSKADIGQHRPCWRHWACLAGSRSPDRLMGVPAKGVGIGPPWSAGEALQSSRPAPRFCDARAGGL